MSDTPFEPEPEIPNLEDDLRGAHIPSPAEKEKADQIAAEQARVRKLYLLQRMQEPLFREWIMGWLDTWGTFVTTLAAGPTGYPDHDATMFKLGERSAGWDVWSQLDDLAPELASLMRREARGRA